MVAIKGAQEGTTSIFRLLGNDENALTSGLAFVLSRNSLFLRGFLRKIGLKHFRNFEKIFKNTKIMTQSRSGLGFTDVRIVEGHDFHVIIEARYELSLLKTNW